MFNKSANNNGDGESADNVPHVTKDTHLPHDQSAPSDVLHPAQPGCPDTSSPTTTVYMLQPEDSTKKRPNIIHAYAASCAAFLLCWGLFGGIAIVLAIFAARAGRNKQIQRFRILWEASMTMSILGLVSGILVWVIIMALCLSENPACPFH